MISLIYVLLFIVVYLLYFYFFETKYLFLFRIWLKLCYKVEVHGLENFPKNGPVLMACNHYSFLDWLIIMVALPRHVHFVIDHNFYNFPILGLILKKVRTIPIASGSNQPRLLKQAFATVAKYLSEDRVVLIFPEGGLTRKGNIQKFRKGITLVKAKTTAPVIPMSVDGIWGSFFSYAQPGLFSLKKLNFKKRKITVNIHPEYKNIDDLDGLKKVILSDLNVADGKYILT